MVERVIFLDTETTGLSYETGDRVIELGCVEMINRRLTGHDLHLYFKVDRESSPEALKVHGITTEFLSQHSSFKDKAEEIIQYLKGAKVVIHNAPFDMGFLNNELRLLGLDLSLEDIASEIEDSLLMAREKRPGKRNSLDALCEEFNISNAHRTLHGALLDSQLLAEVWLAMTKEQFGLRLPGDYQTHQSDEFHPIDRIRDLNLSYKLAEVSQDEQQLHQQYLKEMGSSLWHKHVQEDHEKD